MYGVRLLGIGRLILSIAKMARVDVGLDDTQPNLRTTLERRVRHHSATSDNLWLDRRTPHEELARSFLRQLILGWTPET